MGETERSFEENSYLRVIVSSRHQLDYINKAELGVYTDILACLANCIAMKVHNPSKMRTAFGCFSLTDELYGQVSGL